MADYDEWYDGELWNPPEEPEPEPEPESPWGTLHGAPEGPAPEDPGQWVADTQRWSYHLANDPYGGAAGAWAKQFYDNPSIDPGGAIQNQIAAFRRAYGDAAPEDDIGVMEMIATGQTPQRSQTPTQAWTSSSPTGVALPPPPEPQTAVERSNPELLALLMGRAQQGLAVGRDDPTIRAQVDPMAAQMERAQRNYIDDLAERGMGQPLNLAGEKRMAAERLGQESGLLESQVIGREIAARRDEIQAALAQWGDMLSDAQRITLEREMGYLEDRARAADRQTQYDQFLRDLALREWEANNYNDRARRLLPR